MKYGLNRATLPLCSVTGALRSISISVGDGTVGTARTGIGIMARVGAGTGDGIPIGDGVVTTAGDGTPGTTRTIGDTIITGITRIGAEEAGVVPAEDVTLPFRRPTDGAVERSVHHQVTTVQAREERPLIVAAQVQV